MSHTYPSPPESDRVDSSRSSDEEDSISGELVGGCWDQKLKAKRRISFSEFGNDDDCGNDELDGGYWNHHVVDYVRCSYSLSSFDGSESHDGDNQEPERSTSNNSEVSHDGMSEELDESDSSTPVPPQSPQHLNNGRICRILDNDYPPSDHETEEEDSD